MFPTLTGLKHPLPPLMSISLPFCHTYIIKEINEKAQKGRAKKDETCSMQAQVCPYSI